MTTRMVSPIPLSDFVPDVTLIAFPIPVAIAARSRAFLCAKRRRSRRKNGLDFHLGENIDIDRDRPLLNFTPVRSNPRLLDRCSQARNQRRYQNLLIP